MADWQAIKTEYITTDTSYRKLAQKHDVHYQAICQHSKAEGWIAQREQYRNDTITDIIDETSKKQVNRAIRLQSVADKLLDKIEAMADSIESAKDLRALSAAMKDLKEIQGVKSDLDTREQKARIANLRRQAEAEEQKEAPKLVVEGLPEEFKV